MDWATNTGMRIAVVLRSCTDTDRGETAIQVPGVVLSSKAWIIAAEAIFAAPIEQMAGWIHGAMHDGVHASDHVLGARMPELPVQNERMGIWCGRFLPLFVRVAIFRMVVETVWW